MGEKIYVVGIQFMNFKGNDGQQVDGVKVHYTQQVDRKGLTGNIAGNFFVSRQYWDNLPYQPKCCDECLVYFNRYGKVSSFSAA